VPVLDAVIMHAPGTVSATTCGGISRTRTVAGRNVVALGARRPAAECVENGERRVVCAQLATGAALGGIDDHQRQPDDSVVGSGFADQVVRRLDEATLLVAPRVDRAGFPALKPGILATNSIIRLGDGARIQGGFYRVPYYPCGNGVSYCGIGSVWGTNSVVYMDPARRWRVLGRSSRR
jgi:hypothetical protein